MLDSPFVDRFTLGKCILHRIRTLTTKRAARSKGEQLFYRDHLSAKSACPRITSQHGRPRTQALTFLLNLRPQAFTILTNRPLIVAGHDVDAYGDAFVANLGPSIVFSPARGLSLRSAR